jgi:hypothetical protein
MQTIAQDRRARVPLFGQAVGSPHSGAIALNRSGRLIDPGASAYLPAR